MRITIVTLALFSALIVGCGDSSKKAQIPEKFEPVRKEGPAGRNPAGGGGQAGKGAVSITP